MGVYCMLTVLYVGFTVYWTTITHILCLSPTVKSQNENLIQVLHTLIEYILKFYQSKKKKKKIDRSEKKSEFWDLHLVQKLVSSAFKFVLEATFCQITRKIIIISESA